VLANLGRLTASRAWIAVTGNDAVPGGPLYLACDDYSPIGDLVERFFALLMPVMYPLVAGAADQHQVLPGLAADPAIALVMQLEWADPVEA
jgi:hypothetical protein